MDGFNFYYSGDNHLVFYFDQAGLESAIVGLWSSLDDAFSSHWHIFIHRLEKELAGAESVARRPRQELESLDETILERRLAKGEYHSDLLDSAGSQCRMVIYFLWLASTRAGFL